MIHASLFSGIGGFDLAAEWAGWDNAFNCEIDTFCRKVLKYHFPNAAQYEDIKTTDFTVWRGKIDVLTGGFPCQPFSIAGKRKGTADNRYLWPEMLRAIREIRPRWVVGENVRGIISWNRGMVFEQVHADLEAEGFEVQAFVLPACGVDAPHQRYRTWFVAHHTDAGYENVQEREDGLCSNGHASDAVCNGCRLWSTKGCQTREWNIFSGEQERDEVRSTHNGYYSKRASSHSNCQRRDQFEPSRESITQKVRNCENCQQIERWTNFPTQSPVCSRDDGFPISMDGITFPRWRAKSIKAYGNAIVPQIAYRIFNTINKMEEYDTHWHRPRG